MFAVIKWFEITSLRWSNQNREREVRMRPLSGIP